MQSKRNHGQIATSKSQGLKRKAAQNAQRRRRALKERAAAAFVLASRKTLGISKRGSLLSIQILSLEVVLQRLDLQHGGKHQDADLEDRPPHGSYVDPFGLAVEAHLLLLHVVRLVQYLGELVVQLDDLDLEPVLRGT